MPPQATVMMPEASVLKLIFENAPIVGVIVASVVVLLVVIARHFGFATLIGDKSKLVDDGKINAVSSGVIEIKTKLDGLESRLSTVEHDVTSRATQAEVHKLELAVVRMEAEMRAQGMTISAISSGVDRIQEFMYRAAARSKDD